MSWGRRVYLNIKSLKEMANLVSELTSRLKRLNIYEFSGVHRANWTESEKSVILKCVIAGKNNAISFCFSVKKSYILQAPSILTISCVRRTTKKLIVMLSSKWEVVILKRLYFLPVSIKNSLVNCTRLILNGFSKSVTLQKRIFACRLTIRARKFSLHSNETELILHPSFWKRFQAKWLLKYTRR